VVLDELTATCAALEAAHGDVLDIEFTVERSTLYFLQVRSAKRTPEAAVRIAADLLAEGTVSPARALDRVSPEQIRQVQRPGFDADEVAEARSGDRVLTTGIGACPGQVSGELVLDPDRAKAAGDDGRAVVLARSITSPADLHGMIAARGIVTATGGSTSHAAVVARALGTTCVVGASALKIDEDARTLTVDGRTIAEGESVSLDGATGEMFTGKFATATPAEATRALDSLLATAAEAAHSEVLGRVTLPVDVERVLASGATGLVTAVDDVLAATGHLAELVERLLARGENGEADVTGLADIVAAEFTPILAAAGAVEVGVRAIDLLADESRELLQQTAVTTRYPQLAVPLGLPALIEAQLEGLARAVRDSGGAARVHLAVRHVSDTAEAEALRALGSAYGSAPGVGCYLTSPRAVFNVDGIVRHSEALWLEVRALQAAMFGIPARQLLTAEPLDAYVARGMLSTDPRISIDPSVRGMLEQVARAGDGAAAAAGVDRSRVGLRLSGTVSEDVAATLHGLGVRRFAVDGPEVRPALLALGKAALGD
jgi:pyruvate,orthophosphate dikinase